MEINIKAAVRVPLSRGCFAIISPEDSDRVNQFKWCVSASPKTFYAKRGDYTSGKHRTVRMHRFILDAPDDAQVDHINGNGLDNRRENLRLCLPVQNTANSTKRSNNQSGYKGVYHCGTGWIATFKRKYLGTYETAEEAALAFDTVAKATHGEFAKLNFPDTDQKVTSRIGSCRRTNKSGFNGVYYNKSKKLWCASIRIEGKQTYLGSFATAQEAGDAIERKRAQIAI